MVPRIVCLFLLQLLKEDPLVPNTHMLKQLCFLGAHMYACETFKHPYHGTGREKYKLTLGSYLYRCAEQLLTDLQTDLLASDVCTKKHS